MISSWLGRTLIAATPRSAGRAADRRQTRSTHAQRVRGQVVEQREALGHGRHLHPERRCQEFHAQPHPACDARPVRRARPASTLIVYGNPRYGVVRGRDVDGRGGVCLRKLAGRYRGGGSLPRAQRAAGSTGPGVGRAASDLRSARSRSRAGVTRRQSAHRAGRPGRAALVPASRIVLAVPVGSLFALAALGALSAEAGGARRGRAIVRVTFWGALAMALTAAIGHLFGTVV